MSDSNPSNFLKNNVTDGECLKISQSLPNSEVFNENATSRNSSYKRTAPETLYSNAKSTEDLISPGTDVCASAGVFEDSSFIDEFSNQSNNELHSWDSNVDMPACSEDSNEYRIPDVDKSMFIDKLKDLNKFLESDLDIKYKVDKQISSSTSKNKSSSNFSIFGQLLNKKPNVNPTSKGSSSSSNYIFPRNVKQDSPPSSASVKEGAELSEIVQRPQIKTKLKSMWNNVKYGWRIKREVNLKTDSAIWLLGQCYHNKLNDDLDLTQDVAEQLRLDLLSKIWLTYRVNFPAIPGTNLVTDSGWGCMLRCGQMMMAQAFICHYLQRDWRLSTHQSDDKNLLYKTIVRWFGDSLSDKSPFSLHHLVSLGKNYGRKAGDWYGPTHAAHVLRDALNEAKKHHPLLHQLCMYVASDGIVFKQDVMDLCLDLECDKKNNSNTSLNSDFATISLSEIQGNSSGEILKDTTPADFAMRSSGANEDSNEEPKSFDTACPSYAEFGPPSYSTVKPKWKSLILFVSVRLGNDKMNPFYIPCLKSLLAYEHCIGIIGGRPKHALYFVGWQEDKIIHMDPHSCQPAIDVEKDFSEKSFHSSTVRMMSFSEMDPSCSIGFYFRKLDDFEFFIEKFAEITAPLKRNLEYPVFALADGKRIEVEDEICHPNEKCINPPLSDAYVEDEDDDYILL